MTAREKWIDIAKVCGLVIVLMNHIGMLISRVNYYGGMFYVPIFFILAGYTYRLRPEVRFGDFVKSKAKRLLIPYAVYNFLLVAFFTLKDGFDKVSFIGALYSRSYIQTAGIEDGTSVSIMTVLNGPTWFLTGLFTALVGFDFLMRRIGNDKKKLLVGFVTLLALATALDYLPILLPWSLDTLPFHMILVGFGYFIRQNRLLEKTEAKPVTVLLWLALFAGVATWNGLANLSIRIYGVSPTFFLIASCTGSYLIMLLARVIERYLKLPAKGLSFVGQHTMAVLCLHLFAFMCMGAVLGKVGLSTDSYAVKALMIAAALIGLAVFDAMVEWGRGYLGSRSRKGAAD